MALDYAGAIGQGSGGRSGLFGSASTGTAASGVGDLLSTLMFV